MAVPDFAPSSLRRLAIADDDDVSPLEFEQWRERGYQDLRHYRDLPGAIAGIEAHRPEVILCDLRFGDSGENGRELMRRCLMMGIPLVVAYSGAYVRDSDLPEGVVNATGDKSDIRKLHGRIWDAAGKRHPEVQPCAPPPAPRDLFATLRREVTSLAGCLRKLSQRADSILELAGTIESSPETVETNRLVMETRRAVGGLRSRDDWSDPSQRLIYLRLLGDFYVRSAHLPELERIGLPKALHDLANTLGLIAAVRPENLSLRVSSALAAEQVPEPAIPAVNAWLASQSNLESTSIQAFADCLRDCAVVDQVETSYLRLDLSPGTPGPVEVVVVEDEPDWAEMISEDVKQYSLSRGVSWKVTALNNGDDALADIDRRTAEFRDAQRQGVMEPDAPDFQTIYCVDLLLGSSETQGIDLIRRIRSQGLPVPIIVLTSGADSHATRESIRLLGVEYRDYIIKGGLSRQRLVESLDHWASGDHRIVVSRQGVTYRFNGADVPLTEGEMRVLDLMDDPDSAYHEALGYMEFIHNEYREKPHILTVASTVANIECRDITDPQALLEWLRAEFPNQWARCLHTETGTDPTFDPLALLQRLIDIRTSVIQPIPAVQNHVSSLRTKIRREFEARGWYLNPYKDFIISDGDVYKRGWQDDTYSEIEGDDEEEGSGWGTGRAEARNRARKPVLPTRVLVLEDDEEWRRAIVGQFQNWRCDVTSATNVQDAVVVALQERPDLLCVDLLVPHYAGYDGPPDRMAGIGFLRIVMGQMRRSRAVVLSDWAHDDDLASYAEHAGVSFHDFLRKSDDWQDKLLRSVWRMESEAARGVTLLPSPYTPPIVVTSGRSITANGKKLAGKQATFLRRLVEAWPGHVLLDTLREDFGDDLKYPARHVRTALVSHLPEPARDGARRWVIKELATPAGAAYSLNAIVRGD